MKKELRGGLQVGNGSGNLDYSFVCSHVVSLTEVLMSKGHQGLHL